MMRWRNVWASHSARDRRCSPAAGSLRGSTARAAASFRDRPRSAGTGLGLLMCVPPPRPPSEEPALIAMLGRFRLQGPAAQLVVAGEPDVRILLEIANDLLEHRGDHRPSAEMTMQ